MAKKKTAAAPKAPKGERWKCSLSKGATFSDGKTTYKAGESYNVSKEEMEKLRASGHFYCQPAKEKAKASK